MPEGAELKAKLISLLICLLLLLPVTVTAGGKGSGRHKSYSSSSVKRDSNGHIARSSAAKSDFMKQSGYPHGRQGYVVDHVVPLKKGGSDSPSNMQWQSKEAAKAKDKWE